MLLKEIHNALNNLHTNKKNTKERKEERKKDREWIKTDSEPLSVASRMEELFIMHFYEHTLDLWNTQS